MDHHDDPILATVRLYDVIRTGDVSAGAILDGARDATCHAAIAELAIRRMIPTTDCRWSAYAPTRWHDDIDGDLGAALVKMQELGCGALSRAYYAMTWNRATRPLLIVHAVHASDLESFAPGELAELMGR